MIDSAAAWEPGDSGIKPVKDAGRSQYREYWRARGRRSGADHPDSSGTRGRGINRLGSAEDPGVVERLQVRREISPKDLGGMPIGDRRSGGQDLDRGEGRPAGPVELAAQQQRPLAAEESGLQD